jgi:Ca-activated chloride channel family protein
LQEYGIKVYTIGWNNGMAQFPLCLCIKWKKRFLYKMLPVEIDQELMKTIAKNTGGKYFIVSNKN